MGGLTLAQLMNKLFNASTGAIDAFTFTYDNTAGAEKMFLKIGEDGATNEIADFTQLFADLNAFKATALADMEVKRADAEQSANEALASETDAEAAQVAAEAAQAVRSSTRSFSNLRKPSVPNHTNRNPAGNYYIPAIRRPIQRST